MGNHFRGGDFYCGINPDGIFRNQIKLFEFLFSGKTVAVVRNGKIIPENLKNAFYRSSAVNEDQAGRPRRHSRF